VFAKVVENNEELDQAYTIRKKVFVEEQGVPLELEIDEFDASAVHFIVYDDQTPIAASRFREYEPNVGKVERVCVLKEYRGKQIGNLLMNKIEQYATEKDFKKLKLNAQVYAIPFYEKLQYKITSDEFMDADIPHRSMEKIIER
jgi:predicted GNAT family N-acyltransferase